jgi:general secretion pathway protein A
MYTSYFGLSERPFSITPDPRYLYMSEGHREALAHLLYGIGEGGGFVQLTGEVGTGKTTLCRCLLQQVPPHVDVALILNPRLTAAELLATACDELRIPYPAGTTSLKVLVDALYQHLLSAHAERRRTVLIIDEAQDLAPEVLEQVRLLTNLETAQEKLLQVILIGQPELVALLERRELRQIAQRITARYHLSPFSAEDTRACIAHRLGVAGQSRPLFTEAAIRHVHRRSGGVPRLISVICDRALLGAYAGERKQVDVATARQAANEVFGQTGELPQARWPRWVSRLSPIALAVAALALIVWTGTPAWIQREAGAVIGRLAAARAATPHRDADAAPAAGPSRPVEAGPAATSPVVGGSVALVAAAPAAPASAPASAAADRSRLMALLSSPNVRSDKPAAFSVLFARWGFDYDTARQGLPCERARTVGLRCLVRAGGWEALRGLDLPAVVELTPPAGTKRYATITSLEPEAVTLTLGQQLTLPITEVDDFWDGTFVFLWKPPIGTPLLRPGMRGRDVEWLRRRIGEIDGGPAASVRPDVYDDGLRARVMAFQASRSLTPDGLVGEETLVHLESGGRGPLGPSLSRPDL